MAVPAGIPLMLVFTGIFVFLVLFAACIVLSIVIKDTLIRVGLILAALMLAVVMGGGAYWTMLDGSDPDKPATASVQPHVKPKPQSRKAQEGNKNQNQASGNVVLVVDEKTIQEDYDALKPERLSVEDPSKNKALDRKTVQERDMVGRKITAIEGDLTKQLVALDSQVQEVLRRYNGQEMESYDMIFWQAKLKKQQYGYIVRAMDEKQKILEKATLLPMEEKSADIARIDKRRQKALEKWKEYHNVLQELMDNGDVFRTL